MNFHRVWISRFVSLSLLTLASASRALVPIEDLKFSVGRKDTTTTDNQYTIEIKPMGPGRFRANQNLSKASQRRTELLELQSAWISLEALQLRHSDREYADALTSLMPKIEKIAINSENYDQLQAQKSQGAKEWLKSRDAKLVLEQKLAEKKRELDEITRYQNSESSTHLNAALVSLDSLEQSLKNDLISGNKTAETSFETELLTAELAELKARAEQTDSQANAIFDKIEVSHEVKTKESVTGFEVGFRWPSLGSASADSALRRAATKESEIKLRSLKMNVGRSFESQRKDLLDNLSALKKSQVFAGNATKLNGDLSFTAEHQRSQILGRLKSVEMRREIRRQYFDYLKNYFWQNPESIENRLISKP